MNENCWKTAHNGDVLCPVCGGIGAASCVCPTPAEVTPAQAHTAEDEAPAMGARGDCDEHVADPHAPGCPAGDPLDAVAVGPISRYLEKLARS